MYIIIILCGIILSYDYNSSRLLLSPLKFQGSSLICLAVSLSILVALMIKFGYVCSFTVRYYISTKKKKTVF